MEFLKRFSNDEHGGMSVEYSIIAVLVSIVGIGALLIIGPAVSSMFTDAGAPF
jgi:Flp pilus assembly pilin Flp